MALMAPVLTTNRTLDLNNGQMDDDVMDEIDGSP